MAWNRWDVHAEVVLGLALLASAYLVGVGPLARRHGWAERLPRVRPLAFFGGLGLVFLALNGPLHELSDRYLFSAHMVQHLLLTLVVPPLLLAGTPGWLLSPLLAWRGVGSAGRVLGRPLCAFAAYTVVLAAWHLPVLYEWAMRDHGVHVLQHLLFMATGLLLWWPVLSPVPELPPLPYPARMLYLFLAGVPMVLVAALITLSDEVLYPSYGDAPLAWGLTPLADQRAGGVIMWVPGTLVFLVAITIVFFCWVGAEPEREEGFARRSGGSRHGTA
ncbi:MAG: cytochrome c oxidase assembly protein [Candidatus Rokubacteria bacterium]|nr:cytochrome c oxidase assembly protein [Candidatus Rokubacteria bacterium]